ncbi:carbohydrate sulfotransferase 8-like [Mobula hypostoma]|uniref:carbohydrate sulfotransferase 8-like n=1 Tax=Mobula hypostoma TaxID=723540 RepID=UPI002FC394D8
MRLSYLFTFILLFGMLGLLFLIHIQDLLEVNHQETTEIGAPLIPGETQGECDWSYNAESPAAQPIATPDHLTWSSSHRAMPRRRQALPQNPSFRGQQRRRRRKASDGMRQTALQWRPHHHQWTPDQGPARYHQLRERRSAPRLLGPQGRRGLGDVQQGRRQWVEEACLKYRGGGSSLGPGLLSPHHVSRIYVEDRHRLLYCEVPKAGCSNWKRVLMVLSGLASSPAHIEHQVAHYGNSLRRLDSFDRAGMAWRLRTYTKALFVREPLERLVSAFRDKFEQPNAYYHPVFGRAIIARYRPNATRQALLSGSGVTFPEFVRYLLDPRRPLGLDIHWERVGRLCSPCLIRYDFIGHFESLGAEAQALLRLVGAPANLTFPRSKDRHRGVERTSLRLSRRYLAQLSADQRRRAEDFYLADYTMFNYTRSFGAGLG